MHFVLVATVFLMCAIADAQSPVASDDAILPAESTDDIEAEKQKTARDERTERLNQEVGNHVTQQIFDAMQATADLRADCYRMHDGPRARPTSNAEVVLILDGMEDNRAWFRLCGRIVESAQLHPPPFDNKDLEKFHTHLTRLGYFGGVRCSVMEDHHVMTCEMTRHPMVRSTGVVGKLPFSILRTDVKQRLYLRPGALLTSDNAGVERQRQRLHDYLRDSGHFRSKTDFKLTPEDGAEPDMGFHVDAVIDGGQQHRLGDVTITGTRLMDEDEARDILTHYWLPWVQIHFQPQQFEDDLDRMSRRIQKRGWPEARVKGEFKLDKETGLADVTLDIKSGPIVHTAFVGNKALDDSELEDESTFEDAQSVDSGTADDMAKNIRQHYQRDGYFNAQVEARLRSTSPTVSEAVFLIDEGPKAKVVDVVYRGNNSFPKERLIKGAGLLLAGAKRWVYEYSDHDIAVLRQFYHDQGFANAQIATSYEQTAEDELTVYFDIDEGPRRMVESVTFNGLPDTPNAKAVPLKVTEKDGAPFVQESSDGDARLLSALLAADGFPKNKVNQHVDGPGTDAAGTMRIVYDIEAGEQSRFGGVLMRGAFRTRQSLIEQELALKKGAALDVTAIGAATRRLRALGIFSSVQLTPLEDFEGDSGETWLLAQLQERPAVRLDGSVSYSTNDAFQVGGDFSDRNVLGRALQFTLRVRWGNANQDIPLVPATGNMDEVIATLRAPRPFGLPFDIVYRATYVYQDRSPYDDFINSQNNEVSPQANLNTIGYDERRLAASVALVRTLLRRGKCIFCPAIIGSLNYELAGITTWYNAGRVSSNFGRFFPLMTVDARDSVTDPRRGWFLEGRAELAEKPFGLILENPQSFYRIISRASIFLTLGSPLKHPHPKDDIAFGGPLVLALNGVYGFGAPIGAKANCADTPGAQRCELPPSEVFAYGGDFSLRGLRLRESFDANSSARKMFNGTAELRWYMIEDLGFGTLQV
ncbi:MAG: BamA/TamA family outer membrane protein, partial [Clostridia bacterium]|nr:BamA/TamA family outer membrane protein [Deltaproteobacteria bacterium]